MAYEAGKWLVNCMRCGFQRKAPDEVVKQWNGLIVCHPTIKGCFETRHPQEFVRAKPDDQSVPFTGGPKDLTSAGQPVNDQTPTVVDSSVGVQETTIPSGNFTTNNSTLED